MARELLLRALNRLSSALPRKYLRTLADFPGVLPVMEFLSRSSLSETRTPEGQRLLFNPLFHSNLVATGDLSGYETGIRNAILKLARPGMVAYDVGANVGVFSFLFAAKVGEAGMVYAFEPERVNAGCLRRAIALNGCANIVLDMRAVSSASGTAQFDRRGGGFSGRLVGDAAGYSPTMNIESTGTVSIDDLVEREGCRPPDIVKIDVEGNEGLVLGGMTRTLAARPPIIICELHDYDRGTVAFVLSRLGEHGYAIFDAANGTAVNWRAESGTPAPDISHVWAIPAQAA